MTISSQSRKAGPFTGNGSTTAFPFAFKVFAASDVYVVRANTSGTESVLTSGTDYSVTLNANQNSNPGGTVTLTSALATNFKLVITSAVPNLQPVDITNNGGFYPKVINDALDRVTIMAQQIALDASRGVKVPITSSLTGDEFTDQLFDARDEAVTSASNAATSATNAATSAASAAGSATTATTKASEASTSASGAASSATAAAGSATAAAGSATTAGNSATTATNKANEAASSATAAAASATAAAGSATTATTKAGEATTAAAAAAGSQTAAASSASSAGTSATNASNSATSASNSATSATSSASAASSSASSASTSASTATTKASEASTSAANAATSATNAASSATSASASATSATNSAAAAATSETNAASSASSAAASAAAAATALDNFDDRYLGAKSSNPTVDNDGNALVTGALFYRTTAPIGMKVWDGSQWLEASAAQQASMVTFEYVATAGQTTFSGNDANGVALSYIVGGVMVALNGLRLRPGDDFTASNGTSIVLSSAAASGDELVIDAFRTFDVANTYTQAQVDAAIAGRQPVDSELTTLAGMSSSRATFLASTEGLGFRNRIINGDMRIDQRNSGASVTANDGVFAVDRFRFSMTQSSKGTGQRSSTAPTGFNNSLLFTSSAATSLGASDQFAIVQPIEGFNIADLGWGTVAAQTVTLSFWVRSSLTGTFGGSLQNQGANRSYPFTYAISAANTWEQKTITIAGDTTGTWNTDNNGGIRLFISLGMGSTSSGTAGSWAGSNFQSATGAVSVVGTNGATFYITGVQLEAGSVASPFERRDYGRELMMCQRYYEVIGGGANVYPLVTCWAADSAGTTDTLMPFKVTKRASPTTTLVGTWGGSGWTSLTPRFMSEQGFSILTQGPAQALIQFHPNSSDDKITASAEL